MLNAINMKIGLTCLISFFLSIGFAQIDMDPVFKQYCDNMGLELFMPVEDSSRDVAIVENDYLNYHFAIRSRKEKMEIRYYLEPERADNKLAGLPHVSLSRLLMHLASNDDDAHVVVHPMEEEELTYDFGADWGQSCYFPPKRGFTEYYSHCQMLALYKEGRGMVYILLLFNEAPNTLDARRLAFAFLDNQPSP